MDAIAVIHANFLALVADPQSAFPQDSETMSEDALDRRVERSGDWSALWEQIKANADQLK